MEMQATTTRGGTGYESTPDESVYVVSVEPRTTEEFPYLRFIWVDAKDFAVVRLKAEPRRTLLSSIVVRRRSE